MRLYYHPLSTCSRRVLMTAHHLKIEIDLALVDLLKGEQNSVGFLKLNPNHKVPVLDDDGYILWESYAIMQYLADVASGQTIYPVHPRARADINRWLFWCGQEFMPGVTTLNWENSIKSLLGIGPADQTEVAGGETSFREAARVLDEHLRGREWICDTGLSLADFAIAAPLADQHSAKLPVADLPDLQRWFEQVQILDCWQRS